MYKIRKQLYLVNVWYDISLDAWFILYQSQFVYSVFKTFLGLLIRFKVIQRLLTFFFYFFQTIFIEALSSNFMSLLQGSLQSKKSI